MVSTGTETEVSKQKKTRKKLGKKGRLVLLGAGLIALGVGGFFGYTAYLSHLEKAAIEVAEQEISKDPVMSSYEFADKRLAVEYLVRHNKGEVVGESTLYQDAVKATDGAIEKYDMLTDQYIIARYAGNGADMVAAAEQIVKTKKGIDQLYMLAQAYKVAGETEKQTETLRSALKLDGASQVKAIIEQELQALSGGNAS